MEIKLLKFANNKASINLFIIEEPEAHTHPQLQSVFIKKLKENIQKWMGRESLNLQAIVTSHSARIVDHCDFKDLRYFRVKGKEIEIDNFVKGLELKYQNQYKENDEKDSLTPNNAFNFVKKYINIHTSELFFTDKIIMIEGITESMLLTYFIDKEARSINSQSVTIIEVGANAKVFYPLLDFLETKVLVITDIDSVKKVQSEKGKTSWVKDAVKNCSFTSNETLKFFYGGKKVLTDEEKKRLWFEELKRRNLPLKNNHKINVVYQIEEENYHARSFEDAFISVNYDKLYEKKDELSGLKNTDEIIEDKNVNELFNLTENIIDKKSDFAASLLYLALVNKVEWNVPKYIKDGLHWLAQK